MYQPVSQRKSGRTRGLSRFQTPGPVTGAMNRGLTAMAAKMTRREKRKTRKTKRNSRVPIVVPFKANTGQAVWGRSRTIHAIHEYEPHSGYGPYGRHNREYTRDELFRLPSANGFQVKTLFTADVRNDLSHAPIALDVIRPLVECRGPDLGKFIFCQSIVNQNAKWLPPVRPEWLYRSLHSKYP